MPAPDPGRPAPVAEWQAAIQAWPARGNRENSAELFICVKAASVHVSSMVGKLSVASRGGAAAIACQLGGN